MSKIKISYFLKSNNELLKKEFIGNKKGNLITYCEEDTRVIIRLDKDKIKLKLLKVESNLNFEFSVNYLTKGTYSIKEEMATIYLEIKTKKLVIKDNYFIIGYDLYQGKELINTVFFKLSYEVMG